MPVITMLLFAAMLDHTPVPEAKIDPWLDARLGSGSESFLVLLDTPEGLAEARSGARTPEAVRDRLVARARSLQGGTRRFLAARGVDVRLLWIAGALQVRGDRDLALALAARPEVIRIAGDPALPGLLDTAAGEPDAPEWGLLAVHADQAWAEGVRGNGITVASADTGVEWDHPAIRNAYRGWDGAAADHRYAWHDAVLDLPSPLDDHGHGTHTVGTMVGDDGGDNQVGVSPGARWIGCRNMDHGVGRPSTYLECNQWFLAPWPAGGDPEADGRPELAPDVVNNSWGCPTSEGCDPGTLVESFRALQAAGILAVAAAGNSGPFCSTVTDPPAIYAEPLVAGAVNASIALSLFSSRGPVGVDGSGRIRPDLVAPGESVRSSVPGGGYSSLSGTSMASPHTSGVAALLWSGKPQVRNLIRITECLLTRSSNPFVRNPFQRACGGTDLPTRPNNMIGWGLVDATAALHLGPDGDGDGIADACDCAAADGGAYDPPPEALGVALEADRATVHWDSLAREAGGGTVYDVLRGSLSDLAPDGGIAGASCLASGVASTSVLDPVPPAAGTGEYYLVQGRNTCGAGGYGTDSAGLPRSHGPCP